MRLSRQELPCGPSTNGGKPWLTTWALLEARTRRSQKATYKRCSASWSTRVEWYEAEHVTYWPGGPFIGAQAVLNGVFARIPQDFDGFKVDVRRIVGCGDTVLVEARYRATVKATGKPLDVQVAHIWDLRDGKVVRDRKSVV